MVRSHLPAGGTAKLWAAKRWGQTVCSCLSCTLQAALSDLQRAEEADAWDEEIPALRRRVLAAQHAARQHVDKQLAARMLGTK